MTPSFDKAHKALMKLPGLGYRSAERIALHLLIEQPDKLPKLLDVLKYASDNLSQCTICGNIAEEELCTLCTDSNRKQNSLCIVEKVPDLHAIERSGSFQGRYHILHGRLSPINSVGPEDLNINKLQQRLQQEPIDEVILALSNDIEGEATCHYLQEGIIPDHIKVSRIAFGLPSGGTLLYADSATLKSALDGRRDF